MNLTALHPIGARTDARVETLDPGALRPLLADHGVLVFTGQAVDDAGFTAFLRGFGPLFFTKGETPVAGHPELNLVSNVGRATPPRSAFHVDTTYVRAPPAYTALRAVQVPKRGGATQFTDQYRAYETLPGDLRERLTGRVVTHVASGVTLEPGDEAAAEHPVFRPHPLSGRTALYLSTARRCTAISGMSAQESAETIAALLEHSTRDDNVLRHAWSPGDVVMWDNGAVMHRADHSDVDGDRVLHRGMVAAYRP